jgi:hypothetical protein
MAQGIIRPTAHQFLLSEGELLLSTIGLPHFVNELARDGGDNNREHIGWSGHTQARC